MIREDYLIGWIKRYLRWLAEIAGFLKTSDYEAAARRADLALRELLGLGADSVVSLTEGELLARLAVDEPPPVVRDKCLLLAALLAALGRTAAAQNHPDRARDCRLKALQVVLGVTFQGGADLPEFAPRVEDLLQELGQAPLPPRTEAALMLYHENRGDYARAEDALFRYLDASDNAPAALEIGRAFYHRLRALSDEALVLGGLSRTEIDEGLAALERREPPDGS
jgi:hypothetical protein